MSASQHTTAHARTSTSDIYHNDDGSPDRNPHQHHRYENIVLDLFESDILSVLPARIQAVLLLGAGLANGDNRDKRYRSFYFQQGWTAEQLGISRQALSSCLRTIIQHGLLIKLGKGYPKNRRKGDQPVIFYAVPDFQELCHLADTKTKDDFTRKKTPADIARIVKNAQKVSTAALQPQTGKVSTGRDTLLSSARDTPADRLSTGRDTKRDLLPKRENENGKGVHPAENRNAMKAKVNTSANSRPAAHTSDRRSGVLCSCGNAIPAEKWAAGREMCKECWEKEQRAAYAERKREEEEKKRKLDEEYRELFRAKWAHLGKTRGADIQWPGADRPARRAPAALGAAAD